MNKVCNEGTVEPPDLNVEADHRWILECQQMVVADKNFKDWRKQLDLFQDESGVWRCKGRIQNVNLPYSTKHPILLQAHSGVKETLTELRSKYCRAGISSRVLYISAACVGDMKTSHTEHHHPLHFLSSE